jgi:AraC-like DNA-binding protein
LAIDTTKAVYLIKLVEVLTDLGLDVTAVLEAAGFGAALPSDRERPVPIADYVAAVETAIASNPEVKDLGFLVGERTTPLEHGVLGYALLSSPNLRESLERYVRYQYLQGPLLTISFEEGGTTAAMIAVPRGGRWRMSPLAHRYIVQEWLVGWNQWCRLISRGGSFFEHVRLGYPASDEQRNYEGHLGCTVSFDNPETVAIFPARRLDLPLEYADESIAALCAVQCERLIEVLNLRGGLVTEIHRQLASSPGKVPGMDEMARRMAVGARTLRRQLRAEGTTYQDVVAEFRVAMARRYLQETTLPVSEVAALVGYSDAGNLYRTFRRITGSTPRDYREPPGPRNSLNGSG